MQCTSFVPLYYQSRGVNGASGFSWNLSSSNHVNYGLSKSFEGSLQPLTVNPYLSYDKDFLRQIIQNHESIFRHQVHELHRLYKRQRELMDEMKIKGVAAQRLLSQTSESVRCLSQPQSDITQTSHTPSWLLGNHLNGKLPDSIAENSQQSPNFVLDNFTVNTTISHGPFGRKRSCPEVEYLSSGTKEKGKKKLDLELPADVYHDVEAKQFQDGKIYESPDGAYNAAEKLSSVCPANVSEIGSVKMGDLSNLNNGKRSFLIDLNEPVQLESLSSNSTGAFGAYAMHMEIMCCDPCVSGEAKLESPVQKSLGLLNCDAISDGTDSSMAIDLNSMPVSCFSEMGSATENLQILKKETLVLSNDNPVHDPTMKKRLCAEDSALFDDAIERNFSKTQSKIDLDMSVADGNHSSTSSGVIKSAGEADFKDSASSENEDPPYKKTNSVELQMHPLSDKGEEKPNAELDIIAARALIMISSSEAQEFTESANPQLFVKPRHCLNWFAEIVCSTRDDLKNNIAKLQSDPTNNDQAGTVPSLGHHTEAVTVKLYKENAVGKEKGSGGASSVESTKGSAGDATQHQKRNVSKKASAKPRKCSKIVSSDMVKKSMSSILKQQPDTRDILEHWGKMRKRQGGHRRRTGKFLFAY